jgi:MYXO-CTERM domain-containing protein
MASLEPDAGLTGEGAADGGPTTKGGGSAHSRDAGGCGCEVPGGQNDGTGRGSALVVALALVVARRRRRRAA